MTSDEHELHPARKDWHHYYMAEVAGALEWSYQRYRFDRSTAIGSIATDSPIRDLQGHEHAYRTEAGVRGSRLIVMDTRSTGVEQPSVHINSQFAEGYHVIRCGIGFLVTRMAITWLPK
jgi:hypothetical protein